MMFANCVILATVMTLSAVQPIPVALDGDTVVANVPAGTLDETSTLYLVWDDEDRGTTLADWPEANRLRHDVLLSGKTAEYRFDRRKVAPGQVFRVLATSRVRLLEAGGWVYVGENQYVDTGEKANRVHGLSITFQYAPND